MSGTESFIDKIGGKWGHRGDPSQMSAQVLAYLGDALYELFIRLEVVGSGPAPIDDLHKRAVFEVRAESQARALEALLPVLNDDELLVVRRGRNAHTHRFRKGAGYAYSMSTAFEALLGYLFLSGRYDRLLQIMESSRAPDKPKG